ncbi:TniQ family protein [Oceanobacillus sp. M65]|uniref:TniQ family protein n=1 Tax=Oceanobacillus sp. M65 TaxID=3457435 RepID=UPI003FCD9806
MHIKTEFRESLSGYISRLAESHNLTQGALFSKLITPLLDKRYINNIAYKGGDGFYNTSGGINGIDTLATDFIKVISILTNRDDLNELTFNSWANILPTRGLLRDEKAWCPLCYLDAKEKGEIVYEQLIWTLKIVKYCPIHKVQLVNKCPFCGKKMQTISRKSRPGYCSKCEKWVGINTNNTSSPTEEGLKVVNQVINMLRVPNNYQRNHISEALKFYVSNYFGNNVNKSAAYFGISKSTFRCWFKGENIPTLKSLVLICIKLGIDIPYFLERCPLQEVISGDNFHIYDNIIRKKHDHVFIEKYLNKYINVDYIDGPKSLKCIAEYIGCDRRLLYLKYPKESKIIVKIYSDYLILKKAIRQKDANNELVNAINKLESRNIYPSRRKIEAIIDGPYLIKEREIALKWRNLIK